MIKKHLKHDDEDSVKVGNRDDVRVSMRVTMKIVNNWKSFDENRLRFMQRE